MLKVLSLGNMYGNNIWKPNSFLVRMFRAKFMYGRKGCNWLLTVLGVVTFSILWKHIKYQLPILSWSRSGLKVPIRDGSGGWSRVAKRLFSFSIQIFNNKNVRILCLLNVAINWHIKLNKRFFLINFLHLEVNCVKNQQYLSLFMPKMIRLAATIWKCPDFLHEMSCILDTRIPTLVWQQLSKP